MGYERLTASDDIDSGDRNAFDSIIAAQEGAKRRRIVREKLERLVWILFSVAVVWYGDGTDSLFVLAARRAKVQRIWFLLATISLAANFGILCHLIVHHQFHRRGSKWEVNASWALPASSSLGVTSFVGFGVILWPIYGWATPLVEGMLCMGFLMMTYFIPSTNMLDHKNQ